MFLFEEGEDKQVMGLKPMNCPGHCLIFGSKVLSITLNPTLKTLNPTPRTLENLTKPFALDCKP
jgi:hypothetical protein